MPPHRCQAFKRDQHPCTKNASRIPGDTHPEHLHLCTQHKPIYQRDFVERVHGLHHVAGRCLHLTRTTIQTANGGRAWMMVWCPSAAVEGQMLCDVHEAERQNHLQLERQRIEDRATVMGLVEALAAEEPPVSWQQAVRVLVAMDGVPFALRRQAGEEYYAHPRARALEGGLWRPGWRFRHYWNWVVGGQVGPEPVDPAIPDPPPAVPRVAGLAAIARDNQNVHTRVVTEQTNTATEKLLSVKVPVDQQTEKTLALVWLGGLNVSYGNYLRVATDINKWFNTKDCRVVGDNMYRRLLRGLVALIGAEKDDERKTEMYRRTWEECYESVGMCCEGHLSRLCNVLVGFDEAFQSQVPFGEILQSKMAAIAGMDISDEEKRKLANAFFDEHKTPVEERTAWLDAF